MTAAKYDNVVVFGLRFTLQESPALGFLADFVQICLRIWTGFHDVKRQSIAVLADFVQVCLRMWTGFHDVKTTSMSFLADFVQVCV